MLLQFLLLQLLLWLLLCFYYYYCYKIPIVSTLSHFRLKTSMILEHEFHLEKVMSPAKYENPNFFRATVAPKRAGIVLNQ